MTASRVLSNHLSYSAAPIAEKLDVQARRKAVAVFLQSSTIHVAFSLKPILRRALGHDQNASAIDVLELVEKSRDFVEVFLSLDDEFQLVIVVVDVIFG